MISTSRSLASALFVSTACAALVAAAFDLTLAVLPRPRLVAEAIVHREAPAPLRVDETVAEALVGAPSGV